MPKYKCHKTVVANKITAVQEMSEANGFMLAIDGDGVRQVPYAMTVRRRPEVGDYLVVYEDGFESISPGGVFEAGYTLLGDDGQPVKPGEVPDYDHEPNR